MSELDPNELLTQDEIDKLLKEGLDDLDESPKPAAKAEAPPPETAGSGSDIFSQDDIDALLNQVSAKEETPPPPKPVKKETPPPPNALENDTDIISQDEIDNLLALAKSDEPEPPPKREIKKETKKPAEETDSTDIISQDDIDKLFAGFQEDTGFDEPESEAPPPPPPPPKQSDDFGDSDMISQDEIDRLLNQANDTPEEAPPPPPPPPKPKKPAAQTEEIVESDLISQEEIDRLLNMSPEELDSHIKNKDRGGDDYDALTDMISGGPDDDEGDDEQGFITQDDIDQLLKGTAELQEIEPDDDTDGLDLISQEEIDQLLKGESPLEEAGDDDAFEESGLISQDEIDQLLKISMDEEEEDAQEEPPDQVILEASDETAPEKKPPAPEPKKQPLKMEPDVAKTPFIYRRAVLTVFSFILIFLSSFIVTKMISYLQPVQEEEETLATFAIDQEKAMALSEAKEEKFISISMAGFVIHAPIDRKDITYMNADISVEVPESSDTALFREHAPFFRNIIYNVLSNAIATFDRREFETEKTLKQLQNDIRTQLNQALREEVVKAVQFDLFELI